MPDVTNENKTDNNDQSQGENRRSARGFASMSQEQRREIASKGGKAVSSNREYMAEIGRKGGEASGESRRNSSSRNKDENPRVINLVPGATGTTPNQQANTW